MQCVNMIETAESDSEDEEKEKEEEERRQEREEELERELRYEREARAREREEREEREDDEPSYSDHGGDDYHYRRGGYGDEYPPASDWWFRALFFNAGAVSGLSWMPVLEYCVLRTYAGLIMCYC